MRALFGRLAAMLSRLISRPGASLQTDDNLFEGEVSERSPWGQIEPLDPLPVEEVPEPGPGTRVSANFIIQTLNPLDGHQSQP